MSGYRSIQWIIICIVPGIVSAVQSFSIHLLILVELTIQFFLCKSFPSDTKVLVSLGCLEHDKL